MFSEIQKVYRQNDLQKGEMETWVKKLNTFNTIYVTHVLEQYM